MHYLRKDIFLLLCLIWTPKFTSRSIPDTTQNPDLPSNQNIGYSEDSFIETLDTFKEEYYEPLIDDHYFGSIMDSEIFYEPYSETYEEIIDIEPLDSYSEYSNFGISSIYEQDSQVRIPEVFKNEVFKTVKLDQESFKSSKTDQSSATEDNQPTSDDSYKRQHCNPVEKVVYKEHCVPYIQKKCTQFHQQECSITIRKNCSAVVLPNTKTRCEEVEEQFCELNPINDKSDCPLEMVPICDTVYTIEESDAVSIDCKEIETASYKYIWQELEDITCTFSTELDCIYSSLEYCSLKPTHKCNKTPRKVSNRDYEHKNVCKHLKEKGEKSVSDVRCRLEQVYKCPDESHENCANKKREICLTRTWESIEEDCTVVEIQECKYIPNNTCVEEEKKHCELFRTLETKMFCSEDIDQDKSTVFYL